MIDRVPSIWNCPNFHRDRRCPFAHRSPSTPPALRRLNLQINFVSCFFSSKRHRRKNKSEKGKVQEDPNVVEVEKGEEDDHVVDGMVNGTDLNPGCTISIKDIRMAMEAFSFHQKPAKTPEEAMNKQYQFWNTQPVPKMGTECAGARAGAVCFNRAAVGLFQMRKSQ